MSEISVIMPVYKGIRYLRAALESLRAQTFADWECLCVDDGSKDGSGALADEIAAEDPRIRVIHQANGGTSVARNTALARMTGRYVAFLDEDDLYHPRMLETLHAVAERTGADVTGCEVLRFKGDGKPAFADPPTGESAWQTADRATLRTWMAEMYPGVPYEVWKNLYRREVVEGHLFVPGIRVEQDMMWHYTLLPRVGRYVKTDWCGYAWRENDLGGYIHPDPESLISHTKTYLHLLTETTAEMELSEAELARFRFRMSEELIQNLWRHLRGGLPLSPEQALRLRDGFRALSERGVDPRRALGLKKRIAWTLYMLTGRPSWVSR